MYGIEPVEKPFRQFDIPIVPLRQRQNGGTTDREYLRQTRHRTRGQDEHAPTAKNSNRIVDEALQLPAYQQIEEQGSEDAADTIVNAEPSCQFQSHQNSRHGRKE